MAQLGHGKTKATTRPKPARQVYRRCEYGQSAARYDAHEKSGGGGAGKAGRSQGRESAGGGIVAGQTQVHRQEGRRKAMGLYLRRRSAWPRRCIVAWRTFGVLWRLMPFLNVRRKVGIE